MCVYCVGVLVGVLVLVYVSVCMCMCVCVCACALPCNQNAHRDGQVSAAVAIVRVQSSMAAKDRFLPLVQIKPLKARRVALDGSTA